MAEHSLYPDIYEKGTDDYDWTHVDPVALSHVFEVVKRLQNARGFVGPQYDWVDKVCPSYSISLTHNPSQVAADSSALQIAVRTRDMLTATGDAMYKIWQHISRQTERCEQDIEAYKCRRGLLIVPDEILTMVLEFAAISEPRHSDGSTEESIEVLRTVVSAIQLSHVCKRFRNLMIHSPLVWRRVNKEMNTDIVFMCLSRCRRHNGEVTLSSSLFRGYGNMAFIDVARRNAENWGTFTLLGDSGRNFSIPDRHIPSDYTALSGELNLPHLKKISIRYPRNTLKSENFNNSTLRNAMHFYSSWSIPNLRSFFAQHFVPVVFAGTQSLTSLHIVLGTDYNLERGRVIMEERLELKLDTKAIVEFLTACPNLTEFVFKVHEARILSTRPASRICAEMLRVTSLELEVIYCRGACIKPIFDAVRFPKVNKMILKMRTHEEDAKPDEHFNDIFQAILPSAQAFPNLTDLTLEVYSEMFRDKDGETSWGTIFIPFAVMPRLGNLDLKTPMSDVEPVAYGFQLPPIRTLVIRDCWMIGKKWIGSFLNQMKAQGDLDRVSVSVEGSRSLNTCEVWGQLSKDKVRKLAESGID